jgi:putative thioredoxin
MPDITLKNFETEVIQSSMTQPVLLDIWAPWCGPCKSLGPVLEKLEVSYAGRFRLAKLNSDDQPEIAGQLSQMFGVRSIPFCVLFKDGQPVDGFVGALPEGEVRKFLDNHVPTAEQVAGEEDVQAAQELLSEGDTDGGIDKLREALALDPANDTARYDYLRALLGAGRIDEARAAACDAVATARSPEDLSRAIAADKRDFEARLEVAQIHFAARRFTQAMDELLEIVMRDKTWRDGLARKNYVAILELLGKPAPAKASAAPNPKGALEVAAAPAAMTSDPVVDGYRRRLSMALF